MVPTCEKRPRPPPETNKIATPPSQKPISELVLDKLDMTEEDYATYVHTSLKNNTNIPGKLPMKVAIGKCVLGLMEPQLTYARDHDVTPLLKGYAQDRCLFECGEDWTREHIELMLKKRPHRSALGKKAVRQLCQETNDKMFTNITKC